MKIDFIKQPGGALTPANDYAADKMTKFKSGEWYEVEIKRSRNPGHHRKMFALMNFCFQHWKSDREFMDEAAQFDVFRKNLVVLAGYYGQFYNIKGEVRIEAKSLSYSSMEQGEFEQCYSAVVNAALKHIFVDWTPEIENKLMGFL